MRSSNSILVSLSQLVSSRRNVRHCRPEREAHRRLVASIRAHGLLEPLVVRPAEDDPKRYCVIAGSRRLAALREIYKGSKTAVKVPCQVRKADENTAEALSLAENFVREAMHPLDEAEVFAHLAGEDGKNAEAIAAEFGVKPAYVRQRMKLAALCNAVKGLYRQGQIDTATAEAFAAVPSERQAAVLAEVGQNPQGAERVRQIIAHGWIDAAHALFDVGSLPPEAVSRDLFGERVLIERQAFMAAQEEALQAERAELVEDGWAEVIVSDQAQVQDRLWAMNAAPGEYDKEVTATLEKLEARRQKLQERFDATPEEEQEKQEKISGELETLESQQEELTRKTPLHYAEEVKARGTAFLMLYPDGQIKREYRVPRPSGRQQGEGSGSGGAGEEAKPPTSEDLKDGQLAATYTHQALMVRESLLVSPLARKRLLVLALHERVRKESLALSVGPNETTVYASHTEGFESAAGRKVEERRAKLDPLAGEVPTDEEEAYARLLKLSEAKLDELIAVLAVQCLTAHLQHGSGLVQRLAAELEVDVRKQWRPDAAWLAGFQKIQLAHLIGELQGEEHRQAALDRKKSELVEEVARLFADAAEGRMEDRKLAERVNAWLPSNLREKEPLASDLKDAA